MAALIDLVRNAFTGRVLKNRLIWAGLEAPSNLTGFYLNEPAEYTAAAIMAVNTRGE